MGSAGTAESVAVLGYHDGAAGQIETWFESVTGYSIACFVVEAAVPMQIDTAAENRKRVSQRTEYPIGGSFKGRRLIESLEWIDQIRSLGIRKVLPLTPDNRSRLRQIEAAQRAGLKMVSAIHPSVTVLPEATVDAGVWINAGAIIGYKAAIRTGVIVNTALK